MSNRARRTLSLAALGIAVLVAGACQTGTRSAAAPGDGAAAAPAPAPTVVLVGDSITQSAASELEGAFGRQRFDVKVVAHSGEMFRERQAPAAEAAAARPAVVIINLGTNDVLCAAAGERPAGAQPCRYPDFTLGDMVADADRMLDLFAPGTCLIGVNPTTADGIGQHWTTLVAAGRLAGTADWRAETTAHPSYLADAVGHLTPAGRVAYADFLDQQRVRLCEPIA
jgi:hypothetical protein